MYDVNEQLTEVHEEPLFRIFSFFETIGDTVGVVIAWPKVLILILVFCILFYYF